jgi:hypothetical protein
MRALSLCQSCKRHIRVTESACPFCGAAFTLPPAPSGLRPRGRPGGRAALFLAGAATVPAAPGCVAEPDPEEQTTPVYGGPVDPDAGPRGPDGGAASDAGRDASEPMAMPVYGVAVYGVPIDRDGGRDANVCRDLDEPMSAPEYGIAIDSGAARDAGACGSDAGPTRDAGIAILPPYGIGLDPFRQDASIRDGEVLGTPVYGVWLEIDPQEDE